MQCSIQCIQCIQDWCTDFNLSPIAGSRLLSLCPLLIKLHGPELAE